MKLPLLLIIIIASTTLTALASAAPPRKKSSPRKLACAQAYESAQELRKSGKLLEARETLLDCAQETCPKVIKKDCIDWLAGIDQSLPTIVLEARDPADRVLTDVRVLLDGQEWISELDGLARAIDPGPHTLRFERDGSPPIEIPIVALEGEKNKKISVAFTEIGATRPRPTNTSTAAIELAPRPTHSVTENRAPPPPADHGIPVITLIAGSTGVAALGVFAVFGISARGRHSDLQATCDLFCDPAEVSSARTHAIIADVSLITAVVALGVAAVSLLTADDERWQDAQ